MKLVGLLLVAVPFAFGILRAMSTGTDFRYIWVALASTVTGAIALKAVGGTQPLTLGRISIAVIAATLAASAVAFAQGATSLPAALTVAIGFALCGSVGLAMVFRSGAGR